MPTASLTVVIPVWDDYVRYLAEAVDSVKADAPEVPVVVVDNASATPLPELPGVAVVRSDHRISVGEIRNFGIQQVHTEHVFILDADDKVLPGTLGFLASRMQADPSLSVSAVSVFDGESGERHRFPRPFVRRLARWRRTFAVLHSIWSLFPIQGCAVMRTSDVLAAGGYPDAEWGDDWVLAVSLAFRGRVEIHDRLGRYYRHTSQSLWRRSRGRGDFVASAGLVRERLRTDPAVPRWARVLLPVIASLQLAALYVGWPAYRAARRLGGALK